MAIAGFGGVEVEASFMVLPTAYSGEFFILCDDQHPDWESMEQTKTHLREERGLGREMVTYSITDPKIQRYTASEVMVFLTLYSQ